MSDLVYSPRAALDICRLGRALEGVNDEWAQEASHNIVKTHDILRTNPEIGRSVGGGNRELVISRGRSGYLALYIYDPHSDTVAIKAIRNQRESGYHSTETTLTSR